MVTAAIASIVLVGFGTWYLASIQATSLGLPESITIGIPYFESAALIYIAVDQGYFARNSLNVTLRDYEPAIE